MSRIETRAAIGLAVVLLLAAILPLWPDSPQPPNPPLPRIDPRGY